MAHVRIKLIGAESSRSYFQIDGCGRYDMRDGIAFSIPDGWHTLQAVQVIYDAFSPKYAYRFLCHPIFKQTRCWNCAYSYMRTAAL